MTAESIAQVERTVALGLSSVDGVLIGAVDETLTAEELRSRAGVDFDSIDGNPTHLSFVIVAPGGQGSAHLVALARPSRLLGSQPFRRRIEGVASAGELSRALEEAEA